MESQFEDIRPYGIKELPDVLHRALREPQCEAVIKKFLPNVNIAEIEQQGLSVRTISDFQRLFILPVLRQLLQIKNAKLSHEGLEHVRFPALFISNHRDIIIDPAFLNFCLLDSNYNTTEIAVGNNLLVAEWVSILMRINKSFIVKRGLSSGEQLKAIKQLSAYIRYALLDKQESIWIAQREGRAKDASDLTQESVIKMLSLSGTGGLPDNLKELNIYPVSISYEYDPCDFLKVRELMQRRNNPQFRKTPEDDVLSMQTGVLGYTGRIHYAFTPALNPNLDVIAAATPDRKEQIKAVADAIDKHIHAHYRIYPINKIACDELMQTNYAADCSDSEKKQVKTYLETQLAKINMPNQLAECRHILLTMYANPFRNYLKAIENTI